MRYAWHCGRCRIRQAGGLVLGELDRLVEQRLVGDHARALDAATRRQNDFRLGVVDAGGELLGREAAEHHRMDGADARAGEHGEHRLRHHRHVDDDAVALADAEVAQHGAEQLHFREQAAVSEGLLGVGDGGIVDQRGLLPAPARDVAVDRVVAGVADGAGKPAAVDAGGGVEDAFGLLDPVDLGRRLAPEHLRAALPMRVNVVIAARSRVHGLKPPDFVLGRDCGTAGMRKQGWRGDRAKALILSKSGLPNWS